MRMFETWSTLDVCHYFFLSKCCFSLSFPGIFRHFFCKRLFFPSFRWSLGISKGFFSQVRFHSIRWIDFELGFSPKKYTAFTSPVATATPPRNTTMDEDDVLCFPRKSSWTKLCPLVGSGILDPWIILTTILCLTLDFQGFLLR